MKYLVLLIVPILITCSSNNTGLSDTGANQDATAKSCWNDSDCNGLDIPVCQRVICDTSIERCRFIPDPLQAGGPCNDHNVCTIGDKCTQGICVGPKYKNCDDNNPCTMDRCDPIAGCVHYPASEGIACDDNNVCTRGEKCRLGRCTGGNMVCICATDLDCGVFEDGNLCNGMLRCDSSRHVCIPAPATVVHCPQPQNICQQSVCQPATGDCTTRNVDDGTPCDDFDACTSGDSCVKGQCLGQSTCNDANPCTKDICNPIDGTCVHDASAMDGRFCGDEMACNAGECTVVTSGDVLQTDTGNLPDSQDSLEISGDD